MPGDPGTEAALVHGQGAVLKGASYIHARIPTHAAKCDSRVFCLFRGAVGCTANLGKSTKFTEQMHSAKSDESLWKVSLDEQENAGMVTVRPGK